MKKLTIGSLKYNRINFIVSVDQPEKIDQSIEIAEHSEKETKKIIEIEQNQSRYQVGVNKDQSILDAALEQNMSLDYKCKKGTCGRCKVKVVNGRTNLHPANSLEDNKLKHLLKNGYRLACQARVK